jgi:hypothetical protein
MHGTRRNKKHSYMGYFTSAAVRRCHHSADKLLLLPEAPRVIPEFLNRGQVWQQP